MNTPKLDDTDRAILEGLAEGRSAADLAEEFESAGEGGRDEDVDVDDRLAALAESGLVVPEEGHELTDSGRRVLDAPGDTSADDRIDVPDHVDRAIERADLPPDRAAAIRGAFAFLSYWGEATAHEIRDAIYSEHPIGYGSSKAWWERFVRDPLADLPDVSAPSDGETWRYAGRPGVEDPTDDGRHGATDPETTPYASVKHALEALDPRSEEREAVHAVFALLADRDDATGDEIVDAVYDDHPAGFGSVEEWWDRVSALLEELPGVVREGETWRYHDGIEDGHAGGNSHVAETAEPMDAEESGAGDGPP